MSEEKKRNPAGVALFKMQFGLMMLQCGRNKMAAEAFSAAEEILTSLEKELDNAR